MAIAIRGSTPGTAFTTSATVSLTLTGSRQPQAGDLLVIFHANDFYLLSNMPTPSVGGSTAGVTSIANADQGSNSAHTKAYWFAVASTGDLTVSVTETGTADEEKSLTVYVLSGTDTATPVDGTPTTVAGTLTTNWVLASITTTGTDSMLLAHIGDGTGVPVDSWAPPSSPWVEDGDTKEDAFYSHSWGHETLTSSGASGSRTFVSQVSGSPSAATAAAAVMVAIKSGGAAAAPAPLRFSPGRTWRRRYKHQQRLFPGASAADVRNDTALGIFGLVGLAAVKKVATVTANLSGRTPVTATVTVKKVAVVSARGTLGLAGTSTAKKVSTPTASGGLGLAANAVKSAGRAVTAVGALGFTGTVTAKKVSTPTGNGVFGLTGLAAVKKVARPTVPAPIGVEGLATGQKKAPATGLGALGLGAQHSGVTPRSVIITAPFGFTGILAAKKRGTPLIVSVVAFTSTALPPKKTSKSTGAGVLALTGQAVGRKKQPVTGRSVLGLQAEWLRTPPVIDVNGRVVVTQTTVSTVSSSSTAGGGVSIDPTSDGRAEAG